MSTLPLDENQSSQPPSLSSLIGSRICHDLISPIGAITNGLELLALSGAASGPELDLISESVAQATARIKFFRLAFGVADASPQSTAEIAEVLSGLDAGGRIKITLDAQGAIARERVRALFLTVLCLERAMPFGGEIAISRDGDTWTILGRSDRLQTTDAVWHHLIYGTAFDALSPATVQFGLLRDVASDLGADLRVTIRSNVVSIQL